MKERLEKALLHAKKIYRELIEVSFEINEVDDMKSRLNNIQQMTAELKENLSDLKIRVDFPVVSSEMLLENIADAKSRIEDLKWYIENVEKTLKAMLQAGDEEDNSKNEKYIDDVKNALASGREALWRVRVVEGMLDVVTDCRTPFGEIHLTGLDTRQRILEVFEETEKLASKLKIFEIQLKKLEINEELTFSMDGPLENVKNYALMLLLGEVRMRKLLMEKFEEIQVLRKRLETILTYLNQKRN